MKLYVYCLAETVEGLLESLKGISGAPVRCVRLDHLIALVSELEVDSVPVTRENALTHEAVVRTLLERTTPLPFRFGTLAAEEQLQSFVSARREALNARLASVRGAVEMSVKIIWESSANSRESELMVSEQVQGPGAAFLLEKKRALVGSQLLADRASALGAWLGGKLRGVVREEQVSLRPAEKLVLAAAYLVQRDSVQLYKEKLAEARAERPDLHFLTSGPWAPYSFANIDLEFETHFGVS